MSLMFGVYVFFFWGSLWIQPMKLGHMNMPILQSRAVARPESSRYGARESLQPMGWHQEAREVAAAYPRCGVIKRSNCSEIPKNEFEDVPNKLQFLGNFQLPCLINKEYLRGCVCVIICECWYGYFWKILKKMWVPHPWGHRCRETLVEKLSCSVLPLLTPGVIQAEKMQYSNLFNSIYSIYQGGGNKMSNILTLSHILYLETNPYSLIPFCRFSPSFSPSNKPRQTDHHGPPTPAPHKTSAKDGAARIQGALGDPLAGNWWLKQQKRDFVIIMGLLIMVVWEW